MLQPIAWAVPSTRKRDRQASGRHEVHVGVNELVLVRQYPAAISSEPATSQPAPSTVATNSEIAGLGDVLAGHQVVVDLLLPLGHLQHRLLVGPVGLERVQRQPAPAEGGQRCSGRDRDR